MSVSFVILSDDDLIAIGLDPAIEKGGVAIDDDSLEVLSICTKRINRQYQLCTTCTGNCATGGYVWTRKSVQQQGLFTSLYAFVMDHYGLDKDYITKSGPMSDMLVARWGLSRPEINIALPPQEPGNTYNQYKVAEQMAATITERAGTVWKDQ